MQGSTAPLTVRLDGLRVAITAGAAGIGRVMADSFAACGARVFLCDVDKEALAACPHPSVFADVESPEGCDAFMDAALAHHGGGLYTPRHPQFGQRILDDKQRRLCQ